MDAIRTDVSFALILPLLSRFAAAKPRSFEAASLTPES
jgi:hypothetical protein